MWWTSLWSRFIIFKPCPPVTSGFLHLCLSLTPLFTVFSLFSPLPPPLLLLSSQQWKSLFDKVCADVVWLSSYSLLVSRHCLWHQCRHLMCSSVCDLWTTSALIPVITLKVTQMCFTAEALQCPPFKGHYTHRESLRNYDAKDRVAECSSDGCHYGWFVPWCKDYTYICVYVTLKFMRYHYYK